MSRYIDADLLQEDFKEAHNGKRSLMIDIQPTADVRENVRGEWEERTIKSTDFANLLVYDCPICGRTQLQSFPFCPNCGADMRGGYSPKCC